jgi:hypothetical protein
MASRARVGRPRLQISERWSNVIAGLVALGALVTFSIALERAFSASEGWGWDFETYYDAARRLATTGTPYLIETVSGPFQPGPPGLYLYPPPLALLFQPLTLLTLDTARFLWLNFDLALLALTPLVMPVQPRVRIGAALVMALNWPFLHDVELGNVSLIVTFLAVVTWRYLDRPIGSIALAASVFLRPTMASLAAWWLLRRRVQPALWVVAACLATVVVTLPFIGLGPWIDYVRVTLNATDMVGEPSNIDAGSTALRLVRNLPDWGPSIALLGGYAIGAGAILLSLRRDRELSFVVALSATLLLSPWLHDIHLTHLIVPAAFLASRGHWWGLVLPFLGFLPVLHILPLTYLWFVALAGVLAPFLAPDRGEPAGFFLERPSGRDVPAAA